MDEKKVIKILRTRVGKIIGIDLLNRLLSLNDLLTKNVKSDTIGNINCISLFRSIERLVKLRNRDDICEQLDHLLIFAESPKIPPFPSVEEFLESILSPFECILDKYPNYELNLSMSNPVAFKTKVSLNFTHKFFDPNQRLMLKVKVGLFKDISGHYFWEVGFIHPPKSIPRLNENVTLISDDIQTPYSFSMLQKSFSEVVKSWERRNSVKGIDLSPAFYNIIPLSLRLGGRMEDRNLFNIYKKELIESIDYSILKKQQYMQNINSFLYDLAKKNINSLVITLLLHNDMILHYKNDKIFQWTPPRIIYGGGDKRTEK